MPEIDQSEPRPVFERWTPREQDTWLDFFESLVGTLLTDDSLGTRSDLDRLKGRITVAAELADQAMKEIKYRFWIQEKQKNTPEKKRKAVRPTSRRYR